MAELILPKIRTRFAPSPTGYVHIGNIRTALFGYLYAKHNNGTFVLRIEDTDRARLVEGAVENLLTVMKQLGIEPDEGYYLNSNGEVAEKGEYGPYLQSQRLPLYQKHALELIEKGKAYYCFCSEQRLEDLRKEQVALKKPPMYDRHCRGIPKDEVQAKTDRCHSEGRNPVIRLAMPTEGRTTIHDLVFGDISYDNSLLDDQVLLKSDGFPTYHLAVVIDDHAMEITHVTRTDEWIPSTPKHLLLYEAFGWQPPQFAHLPLVLNPDKTKLSKRQGDVSVESYFKKGYLKEGLVNFLAFLGWNPKTEDEFFTMQQLIAEFDITKVNKAGAVFDVQKLDWINGHYIREKSVEELTELLTPYWITAGYLDYANNNLIIKQLDNSPVSKEYLEAITKIEQERLKKLSEIAERTSYFFTEPTYNSDLLVWKKSNAADAKEKLANVEKFLSTLPVETLGSSTALQEALMSYIKENSFDVGSVLWPLRVALTGMQMSPSPAEVASVLYRGLGMDEITKRIKTAYELIR